MVAGEVVEALPFFSVACSFFQLLERLVGSIPAVKCLSELPHRGRVFIERKSGPADFFFLAAEPLIEAYRLRK